MAGPRRRRAPPKPKPERPYVPGMVLDWRGSEHWSWEQQPCRYCGFDTNLRDSKQKPAHKVCAEDALTLQAAEAQAAYQQRGTL